MSRIGRWVHAVVLALVLLVSPVLAGGCDLEVVVDELDGCSDRSSHSSLSGAINDIADGVIDLIDYFD